MSGTKIVLVISAIALAGCGQTKSSDVDQVFIGTSLPVFTMILNEIVGGNDRVESLINNTQSPHTYHPKPSDVQKMRKVEALVLGSPELDGWAADLIDAPTLFLSDLVPEDAWLSDGDSRNPHFWMDPTVVKSITYRLTDRLCDIRPDECDHFEVNGALFAQQLDSLDAAISSIVSRTDGRQLFVAQPFLDYFLNRYNLSSAGTLESVPGNEPPASVLVELLNSEHAAHGIGILAHERLPQTTARVFKEESNLPILFLDPIGDSKSTSYADFMINIAQAIDALIMSSK